jgi:hypothetical protein
MTPCTCQYSRSLGNQQATIYERGLKTLALTDSALFLPHVVPFINFNEEDERVFYQDSETLSLLLAGMGSARHETAGDNSRADKSPGSDCRNGKHLRRPCQRTGESAAKPSPGNPVEGEEGGKSNATGTVGHRQSSRIAR